MSRPTDAAGILTAAREYLTDPAMWRKGLYGDDTGRVCAIGAIGMACSGSAYGAMIEPPPAALTALTALTGALPAKLAGTIGSIGYNDAPTTTHADVLAWFGRAVEAAT